MTDFDPQREAALQQFRVEIRRLKTMDEKMNMERIVDPDELDGDSMDLWQTLKRFFAQPEVVTVDEYDRYKQKVNDIGNASVADSKNSKAEFCFWINNFLFPFETILDPRCPEDMKKVFFDDIAEISKAISG